MLYHLYELNQAALSPARAAAEAYRLLFRNPLNPAYHTPLGRGAAAALELFERTTRRYRKPAWDIRTTSVDGREVAVRTRRIIAKPFCNLVYFERDLPLARRGKDSKVLIVAPMAGHYPTLLRGTVRRHASGPRGLRHRVARCAPRAEVRRALRSRRLRRLHH